MNNDKYNTSLRTCWNHATLKSSDVVTYLAVFYISYYYYCLQFDVKSAETHLNSLQCCALGKLIIDHFIEYHVIKGIFNDILNLRGVKHQTVECSVFELIWAFHFGANYSFDKLIYYCFK